MINIRGRYLTIKASLRERDRGYQLARNGFRHINRHYCDSLNKFTIRLIDNFKKHFECKTFFLKIIIGSPSRSGIWRCQYFDYLILLKKKF